jgi:hypothetical protein
MGCLFIQDATILTLTARGCIRLRCCIVLIYIDLASHSGNLIAVEVRLLLLENDTGIFQRH